jgi:hypothetical protein
MLRQIIMPSKENPTVSIPEEFYGTEMEILVFPSSSTRAGQNSGDIKDLFAEHLYSFDGYKFDRGEANDYD